LIGIEPNLEMYPEIRKNQENLRPGIELELIPAIGQNMSSIADNSVDAVAAIHVFCTIGGVSETLDEIYRILKRKTIFCDFLIQFFVYQFFLKF
jgi:ubiquinone/menaquinone biosynthesis C-methylase UbiE